MKVLAVRVAAAGFFMMAGLGMLCGVDSYACAYRALIGAIVLYALTSFLGQIAINLVSEAMAKAPVKPSNREDAAGDATNQ